jgi:RsiW-degrading membrane proteinase PrsW (M82 family)
MTFVQLGFSALAAAGLLAFAVVLGLVGLVDLVNSGFNSANATAQFMMAYSLGLMGLLCLPSVGISALRLMHKAPSDFPGLAGLFGRHASPEKRWDAFSVVTVLMIFVLPPTLVIGHLVAQNNAIAWLLLPPLNLLATGLPVLWLALLGMRKLSGGSAQRRWGVFTVGVAYAPVLILVVEMVLIVAAGLVGLAWLSTQPEKLNELMDFLQQLRSMPSPDPEVILEFVEPYLNEPVVVFGLVVLASIFVPLIEELFKPLGVWLLAWKKLTPAQGWVAGVISGAGFALFENLGNTSGGGEEWALVTISRVTAALLHMLTSGLVGWAIASAWTERRYLRFVAVFALAVTIHGLWNGLAIIGSTTIPFNLPIPSTPELPANGVAAVIGLVVLGFLNFGLYLWMNRRLRPKADVPVADLITQ